jgi:hypothetical protein
MEITPAAQLLYRLPGTKFSMPSNMSSPWGLEHRTLGQIDAIGVNAIQYTEGHNYLTLVYQIDLQIRKSK